MMYNSHGNHSEFRQVIPVGNSASVVRGFVLWLAHDQQITPYRFWISHGEVCLLGHKIAKRT